MRSHLFQGAQYYPGRGIGDYIKSGESPDELVECAKDEANKSWHDWWCVVTDDGEKLSTYAGGWYVGNHEY